MPNAFVQSLSCLSLLLALAGLFMSVLVFRYNVKVRRVEWLTKLYEKFYENDALKEVRELIDCEPDSPPSDLTTLIDSGNAKLFDYLNFFEYVAFLESRRHLRVDEVKAMFGYSLRNIARVGVVRKIVDSEKMDLELLRALIRKI
jgi:hypothetical protein